MNICGVKSRKAEEGAHQTPDIGSLIQTKSLLINRSMQFEPLRNRMQWVCWRVKTDVCLWERSRGDPQPVQGPKSNSLN